MNAAEVLWLADAGLAARLDFSRAEPVPRSHLAADLRRRESDVIYRVPVSDLAGSPGGETWLIILVEHQSSRDRWMPVRLLVYLLSIWERERRKWDDERVPEAERQLSLVIPVVFHTGDSPWPGPLSLGPLVGGPLELKHRFVPEMETLLLSLPAIPRERLAERTAGMAGVLQVLQKERADYDELRRTYDEAFDLLERLPQGSEGQWLRAAWYLTLLAMHRRSEPEYTQLRALIEDHAANSKFGLEREVTAVGRTMVELIEEKYRARERRAEERGIRLGEERGIRLGHDTGRQDGKCRSLLLVLRTRFGELPESVEAAVRDAAEERLDEWMRTAVTAPSLQDVGIPQRG